MTGAALVNAETGEVISEMTPDEARKLTDRLRTSLGVAWDLIAQAYTGRAWAALGHPSWDAYCAAEFPNTKLRLPREDRQEVVESMRQAGMSIRAIAATGVASKKTVERSLASSGVANGDTSITGTDGKKYDAQTKPRCTDGFDCPAVPGPDGLCAWHRGRRAANAEIPEAAACPVAPDADPVEEPATSTGPLDVEPEATTAPVAPVPDPDPTAVPPSVDGQTDSGETPAEGADALPAVHPSLPEDWRDRLARSVQLLGCPVEALRVALTEDDVIDLTDLRDHLTEVLKEQNA